MAPASQNQKTMSSRLLTMKFMQRAAASSPTASPISPASGPPSKRQRRSLNGQSPTTPISDTEAIQAALAAEEAKRQLAIERQAIEAGETRWVLSFQDGDDMAAKQKNALRVVSAGFAALDAVDDDDDTEEEAGRRVFGKIKPKATTQKPDDSSAMDDDDSALSEDDDLDPTASLIRSARKQAANGGISQGNRSGPPTPISSRGQHNTKTPSRVPTISGGVRHAAYVAQAVCHICQKRGHLKIDCPKAAKRRFPE